MSVLAALWLIISGSMLWATSDWKIDAVPFIGICGVFSVGMGIALLLSVLP